MTVEKARPETSRSRILDAAHRLFADHGIDGVTMSDVATRARVSRATVFNQFGTKHALVEAITEDVFAGYQAVLAEALEDRAATAPQLIRSIFGVMGRSIEDDRRFYRGIFREIAKITVGVEEGGLAQRARTLALDRLGQLMTRGQARAELARSHPPEDLATAFDSLVFGTITHWLYDDGSEPLVERMLRAADVFLGAVELVPSERSEHLLPRAEAERRHRRSTRARPRRRSNPGRRRG